MSISQRAAARIARPAEAGAKPESKSTRNDPRRFVRSGLKSLCNERFKGYPPQNDEGRRFMIAQLACGLSDDAAIGFGYWIEAELPELRREALAFLDTDREIEKEKKRTLGKFVNMTTKEWVKHKLWQLGDPVDQTPEELKVWWQKRRKEQAEERSQTYRDERKKDKERKKKDRERQIAVAKSDPNPRRGAFKVAIVDYQWTPLSEVGQRLSRDPALVRTKRVTFSSTPPVTAMLKNMRSALHRIADDLEEAGEIESKMRPGKYRPERWVRLLEIKENSPKTASQIAVALSHEPLDGKDNSHNGLSENRPRHAAIESWERDAVSDMPSDGERQHSRSTADISECQSQPTKLQPYQSVKGAA
jgi:hypothetical protein